MSVGEYAVMTTRQGKRKVKTEQQIRARLAVIDDDERYHYAPATVFENAPLALIQTTLETEAQALAWVLGIAPPRQKRKKAGASGRVKP
jgi:hypothetical protein